MTKLFQELDLSGCTCDAVVNERTGERIPHAHVIFEEKDIREEWLDFQHVSA